MSVDFASIHKSSDNPSQGSIFSPENLLGLSSPERIKINGVPLSPLTPMSQPLGYQSTTTESINPTETGDIAQILLMTDQLSENGSVKINGVPLDLNSTAQDENDKEGSGVEELDSQFAEMFISELGQNDSSDEDEELDGELDDEIEAVEPKEEPWQIKFIEPEGEIGAPDLSDFVLDPDEFGNYDDPESEKSDDESEEMRKHRLIFI